MTHALRKKYGLHYGADIGGDELLEHIRPYFTAIAKKANGQF